MKSESLLLNVVCVVMAVGFLGLAGLSYMSSGNFLSTDNLFFSTVAGMMALIFLLVPLTSFLSARKAKKAPAAETAATAASGARGLAAERRTAGALPASSFAAMTDARGRPVPPDVAMMVTKMKGAETENS